MIRHKLNRLQARMAAAKCAVCGRLPGENSIGPTLVEESIIGISPPREPLTVANLPPRERAKLEELFHAIVERTEGRPLKPCRGCGKPEPSSLELAVLTDAELDELHAVCQSVIA